LALISTGERYAVASRGALKAEGAWLWALKDRIDRRWMRMYQDTDRILARMAAHVPSARAGGPSVDPMRCGGCAAKIGPGPLSRALKRLGAVRSDGVMIGLDAPDDAAVVAMPSNGQLALTVDFFRAFISDPYLLGEIAANHALNDIYAMGGAPRHALATAVIPQGSPAKVEEDLYQLLAGARTCFDRARVALVGGHSSEGSELAIGFSVTGAIDSRVVRKGGLKLGDCLVLTKPLGTGILFAAAMRAKARAPAVETALTEMRASNAAAAEILVSCGATAMTDVSGFGLAGHLGEMLTASRAAATLDLGGLRLYEGVLDLARAGFTSTLLPENLALQNLLDGQVDRAMLAILFDPQTAGGLLAGVPRSEAEGCIEALRNRGYADGWIIGTVTAEALPSDEIRIRIGSS
jgi:selenide,water dikinase